MTRPLRKDAADRRAALLRAATAVFAEEGIDMEFVESIAVKVDEHTANPEEVDPILGHTPFEDQQVAIYRA